MTRAYTAEQEIGNFIVSIEDDQHASVFLLKREGSQVSQKAFRLVKQTPTRFSTDGITLTFNSKQAILNWEGTEYPIHPVQRRNRGTTASAIEQYLADNYIVWSNRHQSTRFDLRPDATCYVYKDSAIEPYNQTKWYLLPIADEYFLTFSATSNEIGRVKIRNGKLFLTNCQASGCQDTELHLLSK